MVHDLLYHIVTKRTRVIEMEEKAMPDLNDFYAFNSTGGSDSGGGGGCLSLPVIIILSIIAAILEAVGNG